VHLGPLSLLFLDRGLEEVVRGLGRLCGELVGSPPLGDEAEVIVDFDDDTSFLPCLALGGILGCGFVRFPSAFGEDPAATACRLDEEHVVLVSGERDDACNETLALGAVACSGTSQRVVPLAETGIVGTLTLVGAAGA